MTLPETLRKALEVLEQALPQLDYAEVKDQAGTILTGYDSRLLILSRNSRVYRARVSDDRFSAATATVTDLLHPEAADAKPGRLNHAGQPVFYGALTTEPPLFELSGLQAGDALVMGVWNVVRDVPVQHLGYTRAVLERKYPHIAVPDFRQSPLWSILPARATFTRKHLRPADRKDLQRQSAVADIEHVIHDAFVSCVGDDEAYKYKLSLALAELLHKKNAAAGHPCEGTVYPSAQAWPTGDNIAMLPACVETSLRFTAAYRMEVEQADSETITVRIDDRADTADANGKLLWTGTENAPERATA